MIRCQYTIPCWPLRGQNRLHRQNRKTEPILIIIEEKTLISLCANELGLSIRGSEILWKWLWLDSRVIDCDSSRVIMWKTWLESSHHSSQRDSSLSHQKSWLESSHWLESCYHWDTWVAVLESLFISFQIKGCTLLCWHAGDRNPQLEEIVSNFEITNKRILSVAGWMFKPDWCCISFAW